MKLCEDLEALLKKNYIAVYLLVKLEESLWNEYSYQD